MRFQKGQRANPNGRPKGARNKLPRDLVERVLQISDDLDKQGKGLAHLATKNPRWFLENFLKRIIPKNVSVAGTEPITIEVCWAKADDKVGKL
jgi:hypothetical protein